MAQSQNERGRTLAEGKVRVPTSSKYVERCMGILMGRPSIFDKLKDADVSSVASNSSPDVRREEPKVKEPTLEVVAPLEAESEAPTQDEETPEPAEAQDAAPEEELAIEIEFEDDEEPAQPEEESGPDEALDELQAMSADVLEEENARKEAERLAKEAAEKKEADRREAARRAKEDDAKALLRREEAAEKTRRVAEEAAAQLEKERLELEAEEAETMRRVEEAERNAAEAQRQMEEAERQREEARRKALFAKIKEAAKRADTPSTPPPVKAERRVDGGVIVVDRVHVGRPDARPSSPPEEARVVPLTPAPAAEKGEEPKKVVIGRIVPKGQHRKELRLDSRKDDLAKILGAQEPVATVAAPDVESTTNDWLSWGFEIKDKSKEEEEPVEIPTHGIVLKIMNNEGVRRISLETDGDDSLTEFTIGRKVERKPGSKEPDILISDLHVSKDHAVLLIMEGEVHIDDKASTCGTSVVTPHMDIEDTFDLKTRVPSTKINPGDIVRVGGTLLRITHLDGKEFGTDERDNACIAFMDEIGPELITKGFEAVADEIANGRRASVIPPENSLAEDSALKTLAVLREAIESNGLEKNKAPPERRDRDSLLDLLGTATPHESGVGGAEDELVVTDTPVPEEPDEDELVVEVEEDDDTDIIDESTNTPVPRGAVAVDASEVYDDEEDAGQEEEEDSIELEGTVTPVPEAEDEDELESEDLLDLGDADEVEKRVPSEPPPPPIDALIPKEDITQIRDEDIEPMAPRRDAIHPWDQASENRVAVLTYGDIDHMVHMALGSSDTHPLIFDNREEDLGATVAFDDSGKLMLRPKKSGLRLNGSPLYSTSPKELNDGDTVLIGKKIIVVNIAEATDDEGLMKPLQKAANGKTYGSALIFSRHKVFQKTDSSFWNRLNLMEENVVAICERGRTGKGKPPMVQINEDLNSVWVSCLGRELEKAGKLEGDEANELYQRTMEAMEGLLVWGPLATKGTEEEFIHILRKDDAIELLRAMHIFSSGAFHVEKVNVDKSLLRSIRRKVKKAPGMDEKMRELVASVPEELRGTVRFDELTDMLCNPDDERRGEGLAILNKLLNAKGIAVWEHLGELGVATISHALCGPGVNYAIVHKVKGMPFDDTEFSVMHSPEFSAVLIKAGQTSNSIMARAQFQRYLDALSGYQFSVGRISFGGSDSKAARVRLDMTSLAAGVLHSDMEETEIIKWLLNSGDKDHDMRMAASALLAHIKSSGESTVWAAMKSFLDEEYSEKVNIPYTSLFGERRMRTLDNGKGRISVMNILRRFTKPPGDDTARA